MIDRGAFSAELKSLTLSVAAAVDGMESNDWMKVELSLAEVQDRTSRLLREISLLRDDAGAASGLPPSDG